MTAKEKNTTPLVPPHKKANFRGYTISELRHQRMLTQVRMDFLKEKMVNDVHGLRNIKFMGNGSSKSASLLSIAGKSLRLFSYADLFGLGIALFRTGTRVYSLFHKKK